MIQEGKWYLIAHAVGNDIKGEINIAFGSFNLLFSASYNFAGASISAIDHSIPITVTFDIRIQDFGSYKQIDIKFASASPDYSSISPTIEIISGSDWILQTIQEAVTTNVVCILSEVKTDSGGSFDFSDLFEYDAANQAIRAKHAFYSDSWIGFYGKVGPGGSVPAAQSLLDLSDIDPSLAVAVAGMPMVKLSNGKWGPGSVSIDLSNYFNKSESDERYSFKSHSHDYVPTSTFNSHAGDSVKHTTQDDKDKIAAAYNDKHTHTNKANLDTINQNLSKSSSVEFAELVAAGSIGFYGGTGGGSTPASSLLNLSDIDSSLATAAVGSPLVKLANGKWGPGSVSVDLSNYFTKAESDARFAFKSHSHDYVAPTAFNSHTADMVKHITAAERAAWNAKESALNNPDADGKILASTASGVRSWVNRYVLPVAAAAMLGGVMIGSNIDVDAQGRISVAAPYSHPASHPASMITEDSTRRFLTDTERYNWNDAYDKRHTHGNKSNLDSINQNLSQTSNVKFNDVVADGSIAFYGGVGSGSTPVASLLDLSDIDASISAAATGTPLVKLANGKWGAGSVSIDLSNYYNKSDADARYAFKSHSHDYVTTSVFNGHTHAYLPLAGGTMTGVIGTPNGTYGIIIGDDSRLADRNVANTLFVEGNQDTDRGYINFSMTSGNSLGAINGGDLTWRGNAVYHSGNFNPSNYSLSSHTHAYLPLSGGTLSDWLYGPGATFSAINSVAFGMSNKQVFNTTSNALYIGNPSLPNLVFETANPNTIQVNSSWYLLHSGNYSSYAIQASPTSAQAANINISGYANFGNYIGVGISSDTTFGLRVKGLYPLQLLDADGAPMIEHYANLKQLRLFSGTAIIGYSDLAATQRFILNPADASGWFAGPVIANRLVTYDSLSFDSQGNSVGAGIYWRKDQAPYVTSAAIIPIYDNVTYGRKGIGFYTGDFEDFTSHALLRMSIWRNGNVDIGFGGTRTQKFAVNGDIYGASTLEIVGTAYVGSIFKSLSTIGTGPSSPTWEDMYLSGNYGIYSKIQAGNTFGWNGNTYLRFLTSGGVALTLNHDLSANFEGPLSISGAFSGATTMVASSYIQAAYYKLGNWEIKQNASGELEFILSGALKFKITATGVVSSGEVDFYS